MSSHTFAESVVGEAVLAWLESWLCDRAGAEVRAGKFSKRTDRGEIVPAGRKRQLVQKMQQLKEKAMCKNAYCFEAAELGQGILRGSSAANSAKMQQFRVLGNRFWKGNSWALSCRRD